MVTMVWAVSRFILKGPSWYLIFIYISPLTSLGQHSHASLSPQPQKSATLSAYPGGKTTKFIGTGGSIGGGKPFLNLDIFLGHKYSVSSFLSPPPPSFLHLLFHPSFFVELLDILFCSCG